MSTYTEAVAEARTLVKRSEKDQWRLAELTWQQIKGGKTRVQWAKDIGVHETTVGRWFQIWERKINLRAQESYSDAYNEVATRGGVDIDAGVRRMQPERKAEIARELLADPVIAHAVVDTPEARTPGTTAAKAASNVAQATAARQAREEIESQRRNEIDHTMQRIDAAQAEHALTEAMDRFSRHAREVLRRIDSVSQPQLLGEALDRVEEVCDEIRYLRSHGTTRLNAELAQLNGE